MDAVHRGAAGRAAAARAGASGLSTPPVDGLADEVPSVEVLAAIETRTDLAEALQQRHRYMGKPTMRQIVKTSRSQISRSTVSDMLTGARLPTFRSLSVLLNVLGVQGERALKPWKDAWSRVDATTKLRARQSERILIKELTASRDAAVHAHRESLRSLYLLAQDFAGQGALEPAVELLTRVLDRAAEVCTETDDLVLTVQEALAMAYGALGDFGRADALLRRCLDVRAERGRADRRCLATMNNLAELHIARGRLDLAQQQLEDTLSLRRRAFGDTDPDTVESMERLVAVLERRGDAPGVAHLRAEFKQAG